MAAGLHPNVFEIHPIERSSMQGRQRNGGITLCKLFVLVALAALIATVALVVAGGGSAQAQTFGTDQVVVQGYSIECQADNPPNTYCFVPRYIATRQAQTGHIQQLYDFWSPDQYTSTLRSNLENGRAFYKTYNQQAEVSIMDIGIADLLLDWRLRYESGSCGPTTDNEKCFRDGMAQFKIDYDRITQILYEDTPSSAKRVDIAMYRFYVEEDKALDSDGDGKKDFDEIKPYMDDMNSYIRSRSAAMGATVVDLYHEFNGPTGTETSPLAKGYVGPDHVHASELGAATIATRVRAVA